MCGVERTEEEIVTNKARAVLTDCEHALELLRQPTDPYTFRVLWVGGVALARAVGHVLDKVDAAQDEGTRVAVDSAWTSWKADKADNAIFWEFIQDERNQVLKQYKLGFFEGDAYFKTGDEVIPLGYCQFPQITSGVFSGQDCRDVLERAIDWWEHQLTAIDAAARSQSDHV